jgi:hypothetical protein
MMPPQFDVDRSMAESAFQILTPQENNEEKHEIPWEEEVPHSKKFGRKTKAASTGSNAADYLMRVDAPDFEWQQPWDHVWARGAVPSASAAHYLIERTNKLWESELVRSSSLAYLQLLCVFSIPEFAFVTCFHAHDDPIRLACDRFGSGPEQAFAPPYLA